MTMNNTELTEFVRVHNAAIARHEQWLSEQAAAQTRHNREIEAIRALQEVNAQQLNTLTAGLLELRGMVADYIQGRSQA